MKIGKEQNDGEKKSERKRWCCTIHSTHLKTAIQDYRYNTLRRVLE